MAAQRANGEPAIGEFLFEFLEGRAIFERRELAVRIAGVIASTQLDRFNLVELEFLENVVERKLGQQRSEDTNSHEGQGYHKPTGRRGVGFALWIDEQHGLAWAKGT